MTQSCIKYIVLLLRTLFLLDNCNGPVKTLQVVPSSYELQCIPAEYFDFEISCSLNSIILVKFSKKFLDRHTFSYIQFNCYTNATPLRFSLPLMLNFSKSIRTMQFNSCRFSEDDDILEILNHSLKLDYIQTVQFDNELIDSSLTHVHLKSLSRFVKDLSFKIQKLSALPLDLFVDLRNLEKLSIYSNSGNSSYLSSLLAPLKDLSELVLEINDLQELSGSVFADKRILRSLELGNSAMLPLGFLSHLINLESIYLRRNYFSSLPKDLLLKTKKLQMFTLGDNKVALEKLPKGLFSDLPFLIAVTIDNCGLESLPANIFTGLKGVQYIEITGNKLHELPLNLFVDQEELIELILSRNMILTLPEELFDYTKKLSILDLSDNKLTNLPKNIFKPFMVLSKLLLKNNNLLTISSDYNQPQIGSVFDNLTHLSHITLQNNSINEIPYSFLKNCRSLTALNLSFNNISSINCKCISYFGSIMIDLAENPINCDCESMCLLQHIVQIPEKDQNKWHRTIRCKLPSALNGRFLYRLKPCELISFPGIHQDKISERCAYIRREKSVLVMNCSDSDLNDIPTLPMLHKSFMNGIELLMDKNPLNELSTKILNHNENITLFSICNSLITKLPRGLLSKVIKLKTILLILPLSEIADDIFAESYEIETIKLSSTNIENLPEKIFANQQKLIHLDLSSNKLKTFRLDMLFLNKNLETLKLSNNFIESISSHVYGTLPRLKKLSLDNNRLKSIQTNYFLSSKLEFINLENNEIRDLNFINIHSGTLQTLLLRNNSITGDLSSIGLHYLPAYIDLSLNKIDMIYLNNLGFPVFNKTVFNITDNNFQAIQLIYGNNLFTCDCKIDFFVMDRTLKNMYENLRCLHPTNLKDQRISNPPQDELLCPLKSFCPRGCLCWFRPANLDLIVNCSNASLTEVPSLSALETSFQDGIELLIDHNNLSSLKPHSQSEYKGVTKIVASHNNITNIASEDIPQNIAFLDISYNQLEGLDDEVIQVIKERQNLRSILLEHNPIICECSSENLILFILSNKLIFPDIDECGDGRKFRKLSFSDICYTDKIIWIPLVTILCAMLLLTIFYFKKKESILIWLYSYNMTCLCCVTEEELDKDKKYDAFISYSSLDADFVGLNLVSKLESGPTPYKLCLHDRDWLGGGFIPYQIEESVDRSRRTLIVMSQNYINSRWTRLEFRTAHTASMNEKRPRVIVIMIDDKVNIQDLDSDLRKYIKMYTYLRWGDAWFWERLKYAMPHHRSKKNKDVKKNEMEMTRVGDADAGTDYYSDDNELF